MLTFEQTAWWPGCFRTVLSKSPLSAVESRAQLQSGRQSVYVKPKGLWYGFGNAWAEWCCSEMPSWLDPIQYVYRLRLNEHRILRLSTADDLDQFTTRFGYGEDRYVSGYVQYGIKWGLVARQYAGIEIVPYCWERRLDGAASSWYYPWDVASGCVWNAAAVLSVDLLWRAEQATVETAEGAA